MTWPQPTRQLHEKFCELVHLLLHRVGLIEAEVAAMTKDEAVSRLSRFWAEGS